MARGPLLLAAAVACVVLLAPPALGDGSEDVAEAMKRAALEQEVEFVAADGGHQRITVEELYKRQEEQMHGLTRDEQGNLIKEESKEVPIDELADANPALARVVFVARWAHSWLQTHGLAGEEEELGGVESVPESRAPPPPEEGEDAGDLVPSTTTWKAGMVLRLRGAGGGERLVEVNVARSPSLYAKPHLGMTEAWVLGAGLQREEELALPEPERNETVEGLMAPVRLLFQALKNPLIFNLVGVFCAAVIVRTVRVLATKLFGARGDRAEAAPAAKKAAANAKPAKTRSSKRRKAD